MTIESETTDIQPHESAEYQIESITLPSSLERSLTADIDIGMMTPQSAHHEFLRRVDDEQYARPLRVMSYLRDYIDQKPKTAATFTRGDVVEYSSGAIDLQEIRTELLWLAGSWRLPGRLRNGSSDSRGHRYVNPAHTHVGRYSDSAVQCECGGIVVAPRLTPMDQEMDIHTKHRPDCLVEWKCQAEAEIYRRRRQALVRSALLNHSSTQLSDRFNYDADNVSHALDILDMRYSDMRDIGRLKRRNTIIWFVKQGFDKFDIAPVYGVTAGRIRHIINRNTDETYGGLIDEHH